MLASGADRSSLDVPLVRLIRESEHFTDMKAVPPEMDIVRAVQKYLSDVLEARILVSSPQTPAWSSSGSRSDTTGGYEIRRKDWESVRSIAPPLRKQDWDARAVYLVRVKLSATSSPMNLSMDRGTDRVWCFRKNCHHAFDPQQQSIVLSGRSSTAEKIAPSTRSRMSGLVHPRMVKPSPNARSRVSHS